MLYSGDLDVQGKFEGKCAVQSFSGDIDMEEMRGSMKAKLISGDLDIKKGTLKGFEGKLISGDFSFKGDLDLESDIALKSVSGDVRINAAKRSGKGQLMIKAVSGDIDVNCTQEGDQISSVGAGFKEFNLSSLGKLGKLGKLSKIFTFTNDSSAKQDMTVDVEQQEDRSASRILDMLNEGKIDVAQAEKLLKALKGE